MSFLRTMVENMGKITGDFAGRLPSMAAQAGQIAGKMDWNDVGIGALAVGAGATASWATGGGFFQGAGAGLLAGTAMSMAAPAAGKHFINTYTGLGKARGNIGAATSKVARENRNWARSWGAPDATFSSNMVKFADATQSTLGRRASFGAGAALGGFMFGGTASHSRGFNNTRGNRFGR